MRVVVAAAAASARLSKTQSTGNGPGVQSADGHHHSGSGRGSSGGASLREHSIASWQRLRVVVELLYGVLIQRERPTVRREEEGSGAHPYICLKHAPLAHICAALETAYVKNS